MEQSVDDPELAGEKIFFFQLQYADPTDEPSSLPYDQTFEDFDLTVEQWKGN